jgi:transcriptional regulator with XRE-family HTH domain
VAEGVEVVTEDPELTGSRLARQLGCHHTTVSRWRNGHRLPGVHLLHELASVTEIPYEEIYTAWKGGEKTFAPFFRTRVLGEPR